MSNRIVKACKQKVVRGLRNVPPSDFLGKYANHKKKKEEKKKGVRSEMKRTFEFRLVVPAPRAPADLIE